MADGGSSAIEIWEVGYDQGYPLIEPFLPAHFAEVAKFKDKFVINHDAERYRRMEAEGRLFTLVAMKAGELLGYSVNFLTHNLHYIDTLIAQNDLLYVAPEHRKSRVGLTLIRDTVRAAKARGAQLMMWHAKEGTPLNALLPRLKYEVIDVIWGQEI